MRWKAPHKPDLSPPRHLARLLKKTDFFNGIAPQRSMAMGLRAHGRGLDCETAGAPSEKEFELVHFRRAIVEGLCAHAEKAIAQAPLQRAETLPFETVDRIAIRMPLWDRCTGELLAPIVVMALRAREVELALPPLKN